MNNTEKTAEWSDPALPLKQYVDYMMMDTEDMFDEMERKCIAMMLINAYRHGGKWQRENGSEWVEVSEVEIEPGSYLVFEPREEIMLLAYHEDGNWTTDIGDYSKYSFSHYMIQPQPPKD